jgi:hypothetical protein
MLRYLGEAVVRVQVSHTAMSGRFYIEKNEGKMLHGRQCELLLERVQDILKR